MVYQLVVVLLVRLQRGRKTSSLFHQLWTSTFKPSSIFMSKSKDGQCLVKVWSRSAFGPFVVVGRLRLVVGGILVVG